MSRDCSIKSNQASNFFYTLQKQVSWFIVVISGTSLLGWIIDHDVLAVAMPHMANMTFNTAVCFLLLAVAIHPTWIRRTAQKQTLIIGISFFVGVFSCITLAQDIFHVNLLIDNLLFDAHIYSHHSPYVGRMSPNTSLGFIMSSLALMSLTLLKPHHKKRAIATHALVILIFMTALMGITMNVFLKDIPNNFAHIASISFFTAVSFLLISLGLIAFFQHRYADIEQLPFLYSGVQLMYKLSYPKKFALISIIILVPVGGLVWKEVSELKHNIAQARLKIVGIQYIQQSTQLAAVIAEHRGMRNAQLQNQMLFSQALKNKTEEINQLMRQYHVVYQQGIMFHLSDEWSLVRQTWDDLQHKSHNSHEVWHLHTKIISLLNKHVRHIGKYTDLYYDSTPEIHQLMEIELDIFPVLFEQVGHLRGLGSGFLAAANLSENDKLRLMSSISKIQLQQEKVGMLMQSIVSTSHIRTPLYHSYQSYRESLQQMLDMVFINFFEKRTFSISAETYFNHVTSSLVLGHALSVHNLAYIEQILQQKIEQQFALQYTIKYIAMLVILSLLFLFSAFYQSVMKTIQALDKAAVGMRDGDIKLLDKLPASDELGEVVHAFNQIAEELVRVSSHMKAVVDNAVVGIVTIDERGVVKSFNPASEAIFNYTADEVCDQSILMLIPKRYQKAHQLGMQRFLKTGESQYMAAHTPMKAHGLRKNGDEFPLEVSVSVMHVEDQLIFIGMLRDMSDQYELEVKLRHAQKMEAVGELVGGVAHNFNNLLAAMIGQVFMAKLECDDRPQIVESLNIIEDVAMQASEMVNQLLTFAHKDFLLSKQNLSLNELIQDSFKTAKLGINKQVELSLQIPDECLMMCCDATQIQQVLMNMMNNARDAVQDSDIKSIHVVLHRANPAIKIKHAELDAKSYACLSISDTGHGIPEEIKEKIFEPFFTSKDIGKGTGLGLSTAFGAVTAHKGVIDVESGEKGTVFKVYLPLINDKTT